MAKKKEEKERGNRKKGHIGEKRKKKDNETLCREELEREERSRRRSSPLERVNEEPLIKIRSRVVRYR